MMKRYYIFLCLPFFVLFFLLKVLSTPSTCESPVPIDCGQTLANRCTDTGYEYYNFTLFTDTDVHIIVQLEGLEFGCYNLTGFSEPGICDPSHPSNVTDPGGCGLGPNVYINGLEGTAEGNTYYILIGSLNNDCSDSNYFYSLTLECGNWCGNGILETEKGEECDYGNWENGTARCKPYEECGKNCRCYDLRQDAVGCNFYDYCEDGMNRTDYSSCCVNATGDVTPCCLDEFNNPVLNCSQVDYRRNPLVNASSEYCYVQDYDITDVCIDYTALNNTLRINCGST
jgi:hypothetical protein